MKRNRWKKLGFAFAIVVVFFSVAILVLPHVLDLNRYNTLIVDEIQKAVGGNCQLGRISWGIIGNLNPSDIYVELDGFSIEGTSSFPADAKISRAYAEISIFPLILKRIAVKTLLLESPEAILRFSPKPPAEKTKDTSSIPDHVDSGGETPALPVEIRIKEAILKNGRITVDESITTPGQRIVRHFSNIEFHASNLIPGKDINFKLSLRDAIKPGLGSLSVQGTFSDLTESFTIKNPALNVNASLTKIDMEAVKPYLQDPNLDQRIGGNISVSVNYTGDLGKHLQVEGILDLSQFLYTDPSLPDKTFPGARTTITYQVNLDAEGLVVKQLNLSMGNLTVDAKAVLQGWPTEPVIKNIALTSKIPMKEIEPLIPWQKLGKSAGIVRDMLQKGGHISIENASLPDIHLADLPADPLALLPEVKMTAHVSGISGHIASHLPEIHIADGRIFLEKGKLSGKEIHLRMGPVVLPDLNLRVTNLADKPKVVAHLQGSAQLGEAANPQIKQLLKTYGLKNLSGKMDIALHTTYDHATPEKWKADGSLLMSDIRAESHPAGVVMKDLNGHVTFSRDEILKITVKEISGQVDDAPIRIHGDLCKDSQSAFSIDADVYAKRIDLSNLAALFPDLKEIELDGMLDVDTSVHYSAANPAETRLQGNVEMNALRIRLDKKDLTLSDGNADVALIGNGINVRHMAFRVNNQLVYLKGQVLDPIKPNLQLHVKADDLAIDRLLPASKKWIADLGIVKKASGTAALDLTLDLAAATPDDFSLQGKVGLKNLNLATTLNPASIQGLNAEVHITPETVDIPTLSANVSLPAEESGPSGSFAVELHGQVNNWRKNPALSIQRFNTSRIALASLAPAVPWDRLGQVSEKIRESIAAGGSIRVKHFSLSKVALPPPPKNPASFLAGVTAAVELKDIAVRPLPKLYKLEGITGIVRVEKGVLSAEDVHLRMGPVTLPDLNLRVTNLSDKPKVTAQLKGWAQLGDVNTPLVKKILKSYGLKNFTGKLYVALDASYDHAKPEQWKVDGTLSMDGIRAESHPAGVILNNLNGRVAFSRKNILKITVKEITGKINDAPIRLNGNVRTGGQQTFYVDAAARAEKLDLSHIVALYPVIKDSALTGFLDMDLNVHYRSANPAETQLKGQLETLALGFRLEKKDLTFKDVNTDIRFTGNGISVKTMALLLNDQRVTLEGQMTDPKEPNLQLHLTADDIDIDALLRPSKKEVPLGEDTFTPGHKSVSKIKETSFQTQEAEKKQLPPIARNMTAQLLVEAAKGRYRDQSFKNIKLQVNYVRGLLNHYDLGFEFGDGSVRADGSADLRNLEKINFAINPAVSSVRVESIGKLVGGLEPSLTAPLSISGSLAGNSGRPAGLIGTLSGTIDIEIGHGRFKDVGPAGRALAKILSVVNIQGLISGRLIQDLGSKGLSFQHIKAGTAFDSGMMVIKVLRVESDALNMNARGTVDMVNQQLDLEVDLIPFGTVSGVISRVPVVGTTAASFTKIYTDVQGPLENPNVRIRPTRTVTRGVKQGARSIGERVRGVFRR